jgi:hypothetical protein
MNLKYRTKLNGTRSFVRITFFQNSFFSFQLRWFEMCLFFIFFRIRVLSKKRLFLKEIRTKNNLYKCTKIFFRITFVQNLFFFRKLFFNLNFPKMLLLLFQSDIVDVNTIFKDLATMVHEQASQILQIQI